MPVVQSIFRHNEFAVGIEHNEIRIVSCCDLSLARSATSQLSRCRSHPACQIEQGEPSLASFGPNQRQGQRKACDSTPRSPEIAFAEPLHGWRTRRVVGHDHINCPLSQTFPQFFAIFTAADRRSALVQCCPVCDCFSGEMQVVRARLYAHRESFGARSAQFLES